MTPQDIITRARDVTNDTVSSAYRQSDTELLRYFNDGVREISLLQPNIFQVIGDYVCTPSQSEQAISFTSAQAIVKVLCVHGSTALTEFSMDAMSAFNPGWRADTVGSAKQWCRAQGDLLRFFVYPPAPAATQTLDILYVVSPTDLAIGATITAIPDSLTPALVDYVVFRAESKDDEHGSSGRAVAAYQRFVSVVKGG